MDQRSSTAVVEETRKCPECAYVLQPFDTECPRCALQRAESAHPAPAAPAAPEPTPRDNTSGTPGAAAPPQVVGWNWGAFLLTPFWSIAHQVWIGLLCFVPYVGWVMSIVVGIKGSEWAWQNRRFDSIEQFRDVQRTWMWWGIGLNVGIMLLVLLAVLLSSVAAVVGGAPPPH